MYTATMIADALKLVSIFKMKTSLFCTKVRFRAKYVAYSILATKHYKKIWTTLKLEHININVNSLFVANKIHHAKCYKP